MPSWSLQIADAPPHCIPIFSRVSVWSFLRMRHASDEVVEKIKTHILCSVTFFFRISCRLWDKMEIYGRPRQATDNIITRRMRFACWIAKATNTHPEYALLVAFPERQCLRKRASMLCLKVLPFFEGFVWNKEFACSTFLSNLVVVFV
jgi:hypothetical protein